jgi:hypothetical protein
MRTLRDKLSHLSFEPTEMLAGAFKAKLGECLEKTPDGGLSRTITLPDEAFLDTMARSLAGLGLRAGA